MGYLWIITGVILSYIVVFFGNKQGVSLRWSSSGIMTAFLLVTYPLFHEGQETGTHVLNTVVVMVTLVLVIFESRKRTKKGSD